MWLLGSLCLPGGSQRVSSTRKTPSKVTLRTKSPPSHRSGGFVPLHRPAGAPSSPSAQALAVFFIPGSYFANHFIMGGEKFDSTHPEGYLFGENSDLNFLGNRPVVVGTGGGAGLGGLRSTGAPLPKPVVAVCRGLCGARLPAVPLHGQSLPSPPGAASVDSLMADRSVGFLLQPVLHRGLVVKGNWADLIQLLSHSLSKGCFFSCLPHLIQELYPRQEGTWWGT